MAQFVVLERPGAKGAEEACFVRDGFSPIALIMPLLWLLFQRLWFEAAAVFGISLLLGLGASHFGAAGAATALSMLVSLFVALEGRNWKIAKLRRQGYAERAAIAADDLEEAELRYFSHRQPDAENNAEHPLPQRQWDKPRSIHTPLGPTIGLVGHRGED
ncbi:DUF2628 domain-containing protein [Daeguia caeni]|uniref:DUF2628 domain-containing protein n=1 Tax=Daeguia caeni TaxID=439612 RepID=A0ABV9H4P9_9HYPH